MAGFYHRNIPRHGHTSVNFFVLRGGTNADSATKDKNQKVARPAFPTVAQEFAVEIPSVAERHLMVAVGFNPRRAMTQE